MKSIRPLLSLSLLVVGMLANVVRGDGPATVDQLRQLLADKKYNDVVQKASMALTNGAAQGDRYDLLMIKGEAQLLLKQNLVAGDTFKIAAKAAGSANDAAIATATAELAAHSPNHKYTPKSNGTPIDIADPEGRKAAFAALLADMQAAVAPAVKEGMEASAPGPIIEAIKKAAKLNPIEIAATGSDTQSAATIKNLLGHAQDLMGRALETGFGRVKAMHDAANTMRTYTDKNNQQQTAPQGLSSRDRAELSSIRQQAGQIADLAKQIADLTKSDGMTAIQTKAQQLANDAH